MALNTIGKLAVAGAVAGTGYHLYKDFRNSGNTPPDKVLKDFFLPPGPGGRIPGWLITAAIAVAVIYFFGRTKG